MKKLVTFDLRLATIFVPLILHPRGRGEEFAFWVHYYWTVEHRKDLNHWLFRQKYAHEEQYLELTPARLKQLWKTQPPEWLKK